jgi:hypothetical protein
MTKAWIELLNNCGNSNEDDIDWSYVLIGNFIFKGERI